MNLDLLIAALLSFWTLLALHYIPWSKVLGRPLPPPWSYIVGTAAWGGIYAGWLALRGLYDELGMMAVIVVAAGLAVAGAYALDGLLTLRHEHDARAEDLADRDRLLEQQRGTSSH